MSLFQQLYLKVFTFFFTIPQTGYHPMWPQWLRWIGWAIRNPLPGLTRGWKGKPYMVFVYDCAPWGIKGAPEFIPPEARSTSPTWNPVGGWLYCKLYCNGWRVRHWISYRGNHIEFYAGTKPSTGTGPIIALRKANAKGVCVLTRGC